LISVTILSVAIVGDVPCFKLNLWNLGLLGSSILYDAMRIYSADMWYKMKPPWANACKRILECNVKKQIAWLISIFLEHSYEAQAEQVFISTRLESISSVPA